jgi:hypothetical protein
MLNEGRLRELARDAAESRGMTMRPRRERGLWSFLTWSFFLSQLAVGNAFASGAAQAAGSLADADAHEGSSQGAAAGSGFPGTPDFRIEAASESQSATPSGGTTTVHADAVYAADKAGGIEHLDFASADTVVQSEMQPNSATFTSVAPASEGDGVAIAVDDPSGVDTTIDLPQIVEVPPVLGEVLPQVLETVDGLVDNFGPTLDGLLVPVVETVEDLAGVLGPTLDLALSPVETLADNITGALGETLDPVLAPVAGLAEGISDLVEPVGGVAGELIGLADPVIDTVAPILSPVSDIVEAAQPLLDPVFEIAAPVVDLVEPFAEPLLQPVAPVLASALEILPLGASTSGLLDSLTGGGETDAVGLPGGIEFAVEVEAGGYDLVQAGAYTEFGITLHETSVDVGGEAGDLIGNVAEPIGDLIDDTHDGNAMPGLLGHLQHETALRGLGEGLI